VVRTSLVDDDLWMELVWQSPGGEDLYHRLVFEAHPWTKVA
jgi:hypothetical protein